MSRGEFARGLGCSVGQEVGSAITLLSGVGVNGNGKGMSVTGVGQVSSHGSLGVWGLLGGGPVLRTPAEAPRNRAGRHERLGELRGA